MVLFSFAAALPTQNSSREVSKISSVLARIEEGASPNESKCSSLRVCELNLTNSATPLLCDSSGNGTKINYGTFRECNETEINLLKSYQSNFCSKVNKRSSNDYEELDDYRTTTELQSILATTTSSTQGPIPTWGSHLGAWSEIESSLSLNLDPNLPPSPSIAWTILECVGECVSAECFLPLATPIIILAMMLTS